jgi:hypothetical protein
MLAASQERTIVGPVDMGWEKLCLDLEAGAEEV